MLMKAARAKIDGGDFNRAGELLKELVALPGRKEFLLKLDEEKKRAATNDPLEQRKIDGGSSTSR